MLPHQTQTPLPTPNDTPELRTKTAPSPKEGVRVPAGRLAATKPKTPRFQNESHPDANPETPHPNVRPQTPKLGLPPLKLEPGLQTRAGLPSCPHYPPPEPHPRGRTQSQSAARQRSPPCGRPDARGRPPGPLGLQALPQAVQNGARNPLLVSRQPHPWEPDQPLARAGPRRLATRAATAFPAPGGARLARVRPDGAPEARPRPHQFPPKASRARGQTRQTAECGRQCACACAPGDRPVFPPSASLASCLLPRPLRACAKVPTNHRSLSCPPFRQAPPRLATPPAGSRGPGLMDADNRGGVSPTANSSPGKRDLEGPSSVPFPSFPSAHV